MTIKIFSTDTLCKNCGTDIYDAVYQRLFDGAGSFFDFQCPACNKVFSVDVESIPSFKFIAAEQPHGADADNAAPKADEH